MLGVNQVFAIELRACYCRPIARILYRFAALYIYLVAVNPVLGGLPSVNGPVRLRSVSW